jgi:hypothetical protein
MMLLDVIGCDHLSHNKISISKLTAKGHVVLFDSCGGYVIKYPNTRYLEDLKSTAFLQATEENGLYTLNLNHLEVNHVNLTARSRMDWHRS